MLFTNRLRSLSGGPFLGAGALTAAAAAILAATHPASAGAMLARVESIVTCTTTGTTPCAGWTNTSSGIAVLGTSAKGTGLRGTSTSNYGIKGSSTSSYGVFGESSSNTSAGLAGSTPAGDGVYGFTTASSGGIGVYGTSAKGYGTYGSTTTGEGYGVVGEVSDGGVGV